MITLDLQKGPAWYDLVWDVRIRALPLTTETRLVAAEAIGPAEDPDAPPSQRRQLAWAKAVAAEVIQDWEGVGDVEGNPIPVSDAAISALLDNIDLYMAFRSEYLNPALAVASEGNGSAPLPSGTSDKGASTAADAKPGAKIAR
jgi:hypothetical protein